jgi:2,3-dihydroxybiphenyl 1,2-dioxygenase
MGVTQLGYIGIGVSDVDAWQEYAGTVLGMELAGREEDGTLRLRMDDYAYRIVLHPSGEDDLIFAGWEVKDEAALAEVAERVRAEGIAVEPGTPEDLRSRKVVDLVKFTDPAGLATEVFYGPFLQNRKPFISPRGVRFETGHNGNMGFGHMVVGVPNLDLALRFYRDVLGLRVSDFIDFNTPAAQVRLAFFHANERHHSIAFAGVRGGGEMPSFGPRKRLNHFMVEVTELDDVGRAFYVVKDRGIVPGELGRHTNDHMFSFYSPTPSGFMVEYGWGGRKVDDDIWEVQYYDQASIWGHTQPMAPTRS